MKGLRVYHSLDTEVLPIFQDKTLQDSINYKKLGIKIESHIEELLLGIFYSQFAKECMHM